jgi:hypothetical protein
MTAQPNSQSLQRILVNGPSREELFDALRLRHEGRKVTFTDAHGLEYKASISAIEIEDGSGESWNLKGQASYQTVGGIVRPMRFYFSGYFHTGRRKGHLVS